MKKVKPFRRLDNYGQNHPRLMWFANGVLILLVIVILLMTTEAPVVLYQAF